ncbi:MAG: hypothetical protein FJY56_16660 [Betaproteobacteria bacterium]|nr:hypothetical protein [Betaproteobacteria bacterium]
MLLQVVPATALRAQHITLLADEVTGAGFSAQGVRAEFANGALTIQVGTARAGEQTWKNVRLDCAALKLERARIACDDGAFMLTEKIPLSLNYAADKRVLDVALKPAPDETWRLDWRPGKRGNDLTVRIDGGRWQRAAVWLPPDLPKIGAGVVNGEIGYSGAGRIHAKLALANGAFADKSGLRAGEKVGVALALQAEPAAQHLRWRAELAWNAGEVFWQPVYLKAANQQLSLAGTLDATTLRVVLGGLRFPGVGDIELSGAYDLAANQLTQARAQARAIAVPALYESILKPFLAGTVFADLRTDGRISAAVALGCKGLQSVDVHLERVSFEDKLERRFALFDVSGIVPWRADAQTQAVVIVKGGELLKMPVGAFALPLNMHGMRFDLKHLRVPLLDGAIDVRDFVARVGEKSAYWQFGGEVGGISMDKLTAALGLPVMHGTLAATLPMVRHVKSSLRVDGALNIKVFDGTVQANNLVLLDIFGRAPRVQADVSMQNLDLELLARTFSFGNITGRLDARVTGLELVNWQPVKFDARVASSHGEYPRTISQTAVQNISALGGPGAASTIQRSVLRFFDQFGYEKLGWNCKLQSGVCEMSGVEDRAQGYVLVKGRGIPSITVIGYNRQVNWRELLDRIRRVTEGNVKPIVK